MQLVAIPASSQTTFSEAFAKMKVDAIKRWFFDLKWEQEKVKWGGAEYARVIFTRPGYNMLGGTIYGPGGWSNTPGGSSGFIDYQRKGLLTLPKV